ncbi:LytR/AlgR family response regulator transcription factor [Peribacillus kribbensis]|uniref:LytR/AlgR family response regulator transcription factor n=1 Tax=Peribacillus kribbensis TaxID=356658 RepID=UPI0003FBC173|nr:LytTR family transcriptional regulator DNA-binding domain-containing protein [Peribacillus kribbensis]
MMKAFLVDDEPLARDELKYLLMRTKEIEIIGEAGSIADSLTQINVLKPDLVFLDIDLSGDSGLELAERIQQMDWEPAVVFATAYDEYALQAFELNAFDYLLKPFDEDRIRQTLNKIQSLKTIGAARIAPASQTHKEQGTGKFAVASDERIVLVDISSIVYIATDEGKTLIKTLDSEYKAADTLTAVEKKLSPNRLVRVHRSYLVNLDHIAEIEPWFNSTYNLIMKDHSKVPVSRTYVKDLRTLIGF